MKVRKLVIWILGNFLHFAVFPIALVPSTFLYQEPRLKIEHKTQEKVGSWIGWRIFYIRPFEISHESHIAVEHVVTSDASSDHDDGHARSYHARSYHATHVVRLCLLGLEDGFGWAFASEKRKDVPGR